MAGDYVIARGKALEVPFSGPRKPIMTHPLLRYSLGASMGALALLAAWLPQAARAGEDIVMAPHRAVYEMSLATARGGTGVTAVTGRMVYELTGSACEGYTQNMRFVTQMVNQGGTTMLTDLRSTSWEEGNGKRFRFNSSQYRDEKALSLSSRVYFPVQHSIALISAARVGKVSFRADLYDGSEKGEKVYDTVSVIGARRAPGSNRKLPPVKNTEQLDQLAAWPVSIAYFEPGSDKKDAVPVYELSFLFFENGVSRKLFIDYGEFDPGRDQGDRLPSAKQVRAEVGRAPRRWRWVTRPRTLTLQRISARLPAPPLRRSHRLRWRRSRRLRHPHGPAGGRRARARAPGRGRDRVGKEYHRRGRGRRRRCASTVGRSRPLLSSLSS
jgi:hypothetical protein